jgi:UPF0271 protein
VKSIDLNVDIGEGFAFDSDLLLFATSANICCGVHAGSWELTQETIGLALDMGARIGMHPGYEDRAAMGRTSMSPAEFGKQAAAIAAQIEQFFNFVPAAYLKPHGALYHDSMDGAHPSWAVLESSLIRFQMPILGFPGTAHERLGIAFESEGFADRAYTKEGRLRPRSESGAVLCEPEDVRCQVLRIAPNVDSICLHGDTPDCLNFAELVFKTLSDAQYTIERPG